MQVTISKAAEMVGVTRATLYRHIDKKGITVLKDSEDNPKIDVSELIRVYGDQVQVNDNTAKNTSPSAGGQGGSGRYEQTALEIEVLRARIESIESAKEQSQKERERERGQLLEQIEALRENLQEAQAQQKRLTVLLTDQRENRGEQGPSAPLDEAGARKMDVLEKTIEQLKRQNIRIYRELQANKKKNFFQRLFG